VLEKESKKKVNLRSNSKRHILATHKSKIISNLLYLERPPADVSDFAPCSDITYSTAFEPSSCTREFPMLESFFPESTKPSI
jgi:hypothetical protein